MHKILTVFTILFLISSTAIAQKDSCYLKFDSNLKLNIVDSNDVKCISKNNLNEKTLIYSFGIWCKPCILHLKNAYKLSVKYNVELYVLLIDELNNSYMIKGVNYLRKLYPDIKILALDDYKYGIKRNKKYKSFLKEITPKKFKNIDDMSKYILLDHNANVLMVTNWKDNKKNDWQDDSKMLESKIIPLLSKRNEN